MVLNELHFGNVAQLKKRLGEDHIPYTSWRGKTATHLFKEHVNKLCTLEAQNGRIVRIVYSVMIDVCYIFPAADSLIHILQEKERRIGRAPLRKRETRHTVSGKIKPGETEFMAAQRCLKEKLGFKALCTKAERKPTEDAFSAVKRYRAHRADLIDHCILVQLDYEDVDDRDPEYFSGLPTKRRHSVFLCAIPESEHDYFGYRRRFGRKRTEYEWKILRDFDRYDSTIRIKTA